MSYDMIDRFLRNNLGDDDYAEFSAALDELCNQPHKSPLTDEQILTAAGRLPGWLRYHEELDCDDLIDFARAVERAHGIKETP